MKKNTSTNIFVRLGGWFKEKIRRFLVGLKKNPQLVPLVALCATFLVYSLNLTDISNTTNKIQKPNMGLAAFITMLFMILSFVCMLSAFPKRKKPNLAMIIIMLVLYGIVIGADLVYLDALTYSFAPDYWQTLSRDDQLNIVSAYETINTHIVLVGVTIACVLTEPVIAKLLKKIKTSIDIEGSGNITSIDIADED